MAIVERRRPTPAPWTQTGDSRNARTTSCSGSIIYSKKERAEIFITAHNSSHFNLDRNLNCDPGLLERPLSRGLSPLILFAARRDVLNDDRHTKATALSATLAMHSICIAAVLPWHLHTWRRYTQSDTSLRRTGSSVQNCKVGNLIPSPGLDLNANPSLDATTDSERRLRFRQFRADSVAGLSSSPQGTEVECAFQGRLPMEEPQ